MSCASWVRFGNKFPKHRRPFTIHSNTLRLNIDTSASGVARAALLDETGAAILGFGIEECDRIRATTRAVCRELEQGAERPPQAQGQEGEGGA